MRATSNTLENNHVRLVVEVDEIELAEAIEHTAKHLSNEISVKGFRKGKAPRSLIEARLGGASVLRSEAIRESLSDFYATAVADTLIDPIGQPDVTITSGEEEGALVFETNVEVRPEVSIDGYRDLRVTIPSPDVSDEELEGQINRLRDTDAVLNDVDRPIITGDVVTLDIHAKDPAGEGDPLDVEDYVYTVGSGIITEGVDELIVGLRAGETLSLIGPGPAGPPMTFDLNLKVVKERILPELTDEWVKESTEYETVEAMRDGMLDQMRRMKIVEAQMSRRDAALMALSDLVAEEDAPEVLVDSETNERLQDLGQRLAQQKLSFETFMQVTNQTPDQLLETLRTDARRAVRVDLAMRALVKAEGLEPSDEEIDEELVNTAQAMNVDPEVLRKNLRETGRVVSFSSEVGKMKASKWLIENAMYIDGAGVEINKSLLEKDQSDDANA